MNKPLRIASILACVAFALAACSGAEEEPADTLNRVSCMQDDQTCLDFAGEGTDADKGDCLKGGGTWATLACPTAGVLGTCAIGTAGGTGHLRFYADDWSVQDAKAACSLQGGQWSE